MYLVQRVHGLEIKYSADLVPNQEVVRNDGPFGPFLENTLSQHVLHQLQAARAENEATRKRNREEADAEVFRECEEEIVALWGRLGIIACDPSKRRCTASYMQRAVVTLKNAVDEVEGAACSKSFLPDRVIISQQVRWST